MLRRFFDKNHLPGLGSGPVTIKVLGKVRSICINTFQKPVPGRETKYLFFFLEIPLPQFQLPPTSPPHHCCCDLSLKKHTTAGMVGVSLVMFLIFLIA